MCVFLQISKALVSGLLDIILFPFFPQGIQQQRTKEENLFSHVLKIHPNALAAFLSREYI